jgi:hypothetical protein
MGSFRHTCFFNILSELYLHRNPSCRGHEPHLKVSKMTESKEKSGGRRKEGLCVSVVLNLHGAVSVCCTCRGAHFLLIMFEIRSV